MAFQKTILAASVAALFAFSGVATAETFTINEDTPLVVINKNRYTPDDEYIQDNVVNMVGVPTSRWPYKRLIVYGAETTRNQDLYQNPITIANNSLNITGITLNESFNFYGARASGTQQTTDGNSVKIENSLLHSRGDNSGFADADADEFHDRLSEIVGGGRTFGDRNNYDFVGATAKNNSVTVKNSTIDGPFRIVGGAGKYADGNVVTLDEGTNFRAGENSSLLGGEGSTVTNNVLNIKGGEMDLCLAMDVAGGRGWVDANGNKVNITGGTIKHYDGSDHEADDEVAVFIKGGAAIRQANSNEVNVDTADHIDAVLGGAFVEPRNYTGNPELEVSASASRNTVKVTNVSADSRISAMGAAFDLGFSPKSKLTSTYNTVELGEVNADYAYGSVVFAHAGTSFTLADSSIIRLDGAMVNDVALVNVIDMTDLGETGTAPTGGVTLKDGAAVYLKNAVVMNRVDGVVGDVTVEGKAKLDATGVNRIGGLGSEFKTIVLHVGEENAVAAPQAAVFARSARASASNAVLVFTSSQTLNGVDVTVDGLPGTLGNDYNILGAENNAVVNLSGSMTFEGTFQQVTQNLTNAVITADDPLSAAEVINAVPSEPDPEDPTAPVEPEAPVVTLTGNVKTLAESLLGSVALVNQGADFIANEGIAAMNDAAKADTVTEFGAMHAGSLRYETGSHVDLDGGALALGAVTKVGNSTLAAFFESGWADSESHVEGAKADGDHAYYGLGVAARWQAEAPFYVDGSFRIGLSKTEFNGLYASTGEKAHYDAKSLYTSAHVGAGYLVKLTAKTTLDAYGKYILSYLGSDDVGLGTSGGEKLKLDSTTAHTLQAGLRLTGKCTESFAWRLGAAYEHVFDGDAESRISAVGIAEQRIDAPSISGNTGIFEIGAKYIPAEASAWTFDFGLKGNVGDRRGVTGSAQALYRF